jgi:hypothetical protein
MDGTLRHDLFQTVFEVRAEWQDWYVLQHPNGSDPFLLRKSCCEAVHDLA